MLADPATPSAGLSDHEALDVSPAIEPGIYRVSTQERITKGALFEALTKARFVIVGERHDRAFDHGVQREVYAGLVEAASERGAKVLLGMEMVQAPYQEALDRYVTGQIDEARMLEEVEWSSRWGYSPSFYAPMWRLAREQGASVVALNAPREISRKISQVGIAGLDPGERASLPEELDLENAAHRQWFEQMFVAHGGVSMADREAFERFYQAQVSWDETMAHRAWEAMRAREGSDQMVIVAGSGHVMHGWGIPSRIARRSARHGTRGELVTIVPVGARGAIADLAAPTGVTEDQLEAWSESGYADYIWVQ